MGEDCLKFLIGRRVSLPGHFDVPVVLEDARLLGPDGSGGYECRVRLPDGTLDEVVISFSEAAGPWSRRRRGGIGCAISLNAGAMRKWGCLTETANLCRSLTCSTGSSV